MHWKYFIALEKDLETISRYIELDPLNYFAFSTELSKIFLSSSSEINVVLKQICKKIEPDKICKNIDEYSDVIALNMPEFLNEFVYIERTSIELKPWKGWSRGNSPTWWGSYNKVKHERNLYYQKANLENVLNAMAGLLISVFYFQNLESGYDNNKNITRLLLPESTLMRLNENYYYSHLIV